MTQGKEHVFQAEMNQLLHLIIHSLYTHKEIFLRELVSNASDALNKMRFLALTEKDILDKGKELKITITVDDKEKKITIADNGIGMTEEELIQNLGTIAKSGTMQFLTEAKKSQKSISDLIGQFGVGFYSVFMVTDEVVVRTRSYKKESSGYEWRSTGTEKYTITPIEKNDRGTEITFKLKSDAEEFASNYRIQSIIKKYSNFVDFPIMIGEEKINMVSAVWRKSPSELKEEELKEFYHFIANDYTDPLGHLHMQAEAPLSYSALLFVPKSSSLTLYQRPDEFQVNLYIKRVFIQHDNKELLPQYLRFVRGVVDTDDLPLNVSREVTQSSPVLAKIRKTLVNRLLKTFEEWAEKDKEKFDNFYGEFGNVLKEGIHSDFENKDRLVNLIRFKTTKTLNAERISLDEYVKRMKEGQKEIYYLAGESIESLRRNPNLEYFHKNDYEVLLLDETIDDFIMPLIGKFQDKEIKNVEKAELDSADKKIVTPDDLDGTTREGFLQKVRDILGDKIKDAIESKRLVESPCSLVAGAEGVSSSMERMMKMMDANYVSAKKVFEINLSNPIIKNLVKIYQSNENDPRLLDGIQALYEGALLLDNSLPEPGEFVKRFHSYMEKATGSRIIS